jgi:hypothetical protein
MINRPTYNRRIRWISNTNPPKIGKEGRIYRVNSDDNTIDFLFDAPDSHTVYRNFPYSYFEYVNPTLEEQDQEHRRVHADKYL